MRTLLDITHLDLPAIDRAPLHTMILLPGEMTAFWVESRFGERRKRAFRYLKAHRRRVNGCRTRSDRCDGELSKSQRTPLCLLPRKRRYRY